MKRLLPVCFLFAFTAVAAEPMPDCGLVPGWPQQGEARVFVSDNLFEYMDGNAEGYLIYGFQKMNGVNCKAGEKTLVFDVSEFADVEAAYGMFTANRDTRLPSEKIGMGGQVQPRRAIFVKDKYYVEIAANPAGDHTEALRAFVTAMEKKMEGRTDLPDVFTWFPAENLVKDSVRLVPESVLGLRLLKKGYVGQYDTGKAFIVRDASPDAAAATMTKLRDRFKTTQPAQIADEAFQYTDKYLGKVCFFRKGQYIGGFANLTEAQDAVALTTKLAANVK